MNDQPHPAVDDGTETITLPFAGERRIVTRDVHLSPAAARIWRLADKARAAQARGEILPDDVLPDLGLLRDDGLIRLDEPSPEAPVEENAPPLKTQRRFPRRITIGMATYDDYDGVYFSIQDMRLKNPWLDEAAEFVVIDNNPTGKHAKVVSLLGQEVPGFRYIPAGDWTGTAIRDKLFEEASSPVVMCMDCHVLVAPGAVARVLEILEADPGNRDLIQGPMLSDDFHTPYTHFAPEWNPGGILGLYQCDPRANDPEGPCFDIWGMGLALFACRRDAWPGFNPLFRGYGGEEGYIHEKFRQRGGRTVCWPFLRWLHRAQRPNGIPYVWTNEDMFRNYYIGFTELGWDKAEFLESWTSVHGAGWISDQIAAITKEALTYWATPPDPRRA